MAKFGWFLNYCREWDFDGTLADFFQTASRNDYADPGGTADFFNKKSSNSGPGLREQPWALRG